MFELPDPKDDGLYIPDVGQWSRDKHYFLMRYIDAFTTAMKGKPWAGLHYIDLFAGAGIERLKGSGELDWGSPLIAAQSPNPFDGLHLCELDTPRYNALKRRIKCYNRDCQVLQGDANECIHEIIKAIPAGSLSLAFLDPHGLHLDYDTLKVLATVRADLIIFFPDRLDILRNWAEHYLENRESNLDQYLGQGPDWRKLMKDSPTNLQGVQRIQELYINQIRKLGYVAFEEERISKSAGQPLYKLLFCSRKPVAAKIWRGISGKKPDGQRTFDFGPDPSQ